MKPRIWTHLVCALVLAAMALPVFGESGSIADGKLTTWRDNLATGGNKLHRDVFPGVDVIYSGNYFRMYTHFIVNPGGDPGMITLQFDGLQSIDAGAGTRAIVRTAENTIVLGELRLAQSEAGKEKRLHGRLLQRPDGAVGIQVDEAFNPHQPLVITLVSEFKKGAEAVVPGASLLGQDRPMAASDAQTMAIVSITATKVDTVKPANTTGPAFPGSTIKYTVVIKNTGDMDATGVEYDDTIDANTTFSSGTLRTTPLALNEVFTILEDTPTVLNLNASDPDGNNSNNLAFSSTVSPGKGALGAFTNTGQFNADVTYTPNQNANDNTAPNGADTFSFKVIDDDNNENDATVTISITPVNDAPIFTCGANQTHNSTDGPAISVAGWATGIAPGPATATDEASQVLTFNITGNTMPGLFSAGPAVNANGDLSYTLSGTAGVTTITVELQDDGGTANGGDDTSDPCSFTVTVNGPPTAVADAPAATSAPGDAFHTALNTTLDSSVDPNTPSVLANDMLGFPAGTLVSFGGGSLPGDASTNAAGNTVTFGTGSLQVLATGEFIFTPDNNFIGLFTFQYRLQNVAGSSDATVTIAVGVRPQAVADAFTATGNIAIEHAAGQIHADNSSGSDLGDQITVTQVQGAGGNVGVATATNQTGRGGVTGFITLNSDGSFTYEPPPGYEGNDTFTYAVGNGFGNSAAATVTITVSDIVWFISNSAGGSNRGTFNDPFTSIADFNTANTSGTAPDAKNGDRIALRTGSGTYSETDGINLRDNQILIGEAVQFNTVFTANANSIAAYNTFASGTIAAPTINASAGNGVDLASSNTVRGLDVGNTTGFGFNGGAVGSLTINTVNVTGNGGAINISTSGSFGSNVTFATLSSTNAAAEAINLVGVTGTLGVTAGSISNPTGTAINVSGGSVSMTYPGNITQGNNAATVAVSNGHSGSLSFPTGTNSVTNGTGLQFDNADGSYTFNGTTTLNGGDAGIDIVNGSTGTFTFGTGTSITRANGVSGAAFNLLSSDANVTYSGSMTLGTSTGNMVAINNHDAGTITFETGNLTKGSSTTQGISIQNSNGGLIQFNNPTISITMTSGNAVSLTNNSGSSILFQISGGGSGMDLVTTSGTGFNATGGGTIAVTGAGNSITTTTGTAMNVVNTAISSSNLNFVSISSNGAQRGINLNNTGTAPTNGGLIVTGTGNTDGSGGTISGSTVEGITLSTTRSITLNNMNVSGTANNTNAVGATTVTGLIFDNCNVTAAAGVTGGTSYALLGNSITNLIIRNTSVFDGGGGSVANVDAVRITNLLGTSEFNNSTFQNGKNINVLIENNTATNAAPGAPDVLNIVNGTTFTNSAGGDRLQIESGGTANMKLNVHNGGGSNVVFSGTGQDGMQLECEDNARFEIDVTHATFSGLVGSAVNMATTQNGLLIADVHDLPGTITGGQTNVINMIAFDTSTIRSKVRNNTISVGVNTGAGIRCIVEGNGTATAEISGNTITGNSQQNGIICQARAGTSGSMNLNITGNVVNLTNSLALDGIEVTAGSSAGGDTQTICLNLANNSSSTAGSGLDGYFLRNRSGNTFLLQNFAGNGSSSSDIATWVNTTKSNTGSVFTSIGSPFGTSSGCPTP